MSARNKAGCKSVWGVPVPGTAGAQIHFCFWKNNELPTQPNTEKCMKHICSFTNAYKMVSHIIATQIEKWNIARIPEASLPCATHSLCQKFCCSLTFMLITCFALSFCHHHISLLIASAASFWICCEFWVMDALNPWKRDRLPTPIFLGFPGSSDRKLRIFMFPWKSNSLLNFLISSQCFSVDILNFFGSSLEFILIPSYVINSFIAFG